MFVRTEYPGHSAGYSAGIIRGTRRVLGWLSRSDRSARTAYSAVWVLERYCAVLYFAVLCGLFCGDSSAGLGIACTVARVRQVRLSRLGRAWRPMRHGVSEMGTPP